jgi:cytochrome P450
MTTQADERATDLPPEDFPADIPVVIISGFAEATEILRLGSLRPGYGDNSIPVSFDADGEIHIAERGCPVHKGLNVHEAAKAGETVRWEDLFREDALLRTDGEAHIRRRRALNPLFVRNAHLWFRDTIIVPTLERNLQAVRETASADGLCRIDLVPFAKQVFVQMAAALVGFDGVDTTEGASKLIELEKEMDQRIRANSLPPGPELEQVMKLSLAARERLYADYAVPSMERRRRLVEEARANGTEDQLPHDLLTLAAKGDIPFETNDGALKMAIQLLPNSIGTNVTILTHALNDLIRYFETHPEDRDFDTDPDFLFGALRDTIRLHSGGTGILVRVATEDITLTSGRFIAKGTRVGLLHDAIDRDVSVFGEDAEQYDPRRVVGNGVRPYGVGFGNGPHICIGLPLVLGQGNITGVQVPLMRALFAMGIRPDPDRQARKRPERFRDTFVEFPIALNVSLAGRTK